MRQTMKPIIAAPIHSLRRTTGGLGAIINSVGTDGRLHGSIPNELTSTWWHADGRHNLYRNFDLVNQFLPGSRGAVTGSKEITGWLK